MCHAALETFAVAAGVEEAIALYNCSVCGLHVNDIGHLLIQN